MRIKPVTRFLIGAVLALSLAAPAAAAEAPELDVAFSYTALADQDVDEIFPLGWAAAVGCSINERFALVGELSGNYRLAGDEWEDISLSVHGFMAGPRVARQSGTTIKPFGQVLIGAARARAGAFGVGVSSTALAIQPGGGVDISIRPNLGIRLQGDYRAIRDEGQTSSEFRLGAGLVFAFGNR